MHREIEIYSICEINQIFYKTVIMHVLKSRKHIFIVKNQKIFLNVFHYKVVSYYSSNIFEIRFKVNYFTYVLLNVSACYLR